MRNSHGGVQKAPYSGPQRVALYTRVSTGRQAGHELSITDQIKQLRKGCADRGWVVAAEYTDAKSAHRGRRPGFEEFFNRACSEEHPYDALFVHSLSRYFRESLMSEQCFRDLERAGVRLVSLTEDIDGENGWMMRQMISVFNEHSSRETAKHVKRTRIENAKQGYWNGGPTPLGYVSVNAGGSRGDKNKKCLGIDPLHVETVKLIFRLHAEGDHSGREMGIASIVDYLNIRQIKTASGRVFYISAVHKILTNEIYVGRAYMNRKEVRTGLTRPRTEWVFTPCEPIITEEAFAATQLRLAERRPNRRPPRITTSEVMLGGIAYCESCGHRMFVGTGTGRQGKVYEYYVCSGRQLRGTTACDNPIRVPKKELDEQVLTALTDQLLTGPRLQEIVARVSERRSTRKDEDAGSLKHLKASLVDTQRKLERLVNAVIEGTLAESESVRTKQEELEAEKAEIASAIRLQNSRLRQSVRPLNEEQAEGLARTLRQNLAVASAPLKRRYVAAFVRRVDVSDSAVTIRGDDDSVQKAVSDASESQSRLSPPVQTSVREWR